MISHNHRQPTVQQSRLLLGLWIRWWAVPVVALGWAIVVVAAYPSDGLAGVALGAVNGTIGVLFAVALRSAIGLSATGRKWRWR